MNALLKVFECIFVFVFLMNCLCFLCFSGVAVNFFATNPRQTNENRDILFHFNPRPSNTLVLNTFVQNGWEEEVILRDDEFDTNLFKNPFKLTIKMTHAEDTPLKMTAFGVFCERRLSHYVFMSCRHDYGKLYRIFSKSSHFCKHWGLLSVELTTLEYYSSVVINLLQT